MRRKLITRLAFALTAITLSVGAAAAYADTSGAVSGPLTPLPEPGVVNLPGRNDCAAISPAGIRTQFSGPKVIDGKVVGSATIQTTNAFCGTAHATIYLQTKACGFFGCSWEERDSTGLIDLPVNGILNTEHLSMPLREGTNSYRMRAELSYPELDIEGGLPYLAIKGSDAYSQVGKFSS